MDRQARSEHAWELVNAVLLRHFIIRSLASLLLLVLGLLLATPQRRIAVGALVGGGWMVANCVAMVWMGANALKHSDARRNRYVFGFIAGILGSLAFGGWLVAAFQPVLPWFTVGVSAPLAVFLFQLRCLKLKLGA